MRYFRCMAWVESANHLIRTFTFQTFREAMEFVNEVAELAEQHAHHPDMRVRYNEVDLSLTTHDAGSIVTSKDQHLAQAIDGLVRPHG